MRRCHFSAIGRAMLPTTLALTLVAGPLPAQLRIGTFAPGVLPAASGGGNPGADPRVTMGQVFRAPGTAAPLTSLTYWFWTIPGLYDGGGTALLSLYAFAGGVPTGTPLYEASFTIPTNTVPLALTPMPWTWTPGIALAPGALYIALLSGANAIEATAVLNDIADSADNTTGGAAMICDALAPTCESAGAIGGAPVVHTFEARFGTTAVPEPRTVVLLAGGLLALAARARRRR